MVITGQIDVLPSQRRRVRQQGIIRRPTVVTKGVGGTLQIDSVPQHNGRRHQRESAGAVALLLKPAIPDFTQAGESAAIGDSAGDRPER